jgi:hypothetical protein
VELIFLLLTVFITGRALTCGIERAEILSRVRSFDIFNRLLYLGCFDKSLPLQQLS